MIRAKRPNFLLSVVVMATLAAFLATALAVVAVATLLGRNDEHDHLERLYAETERTVRSAIDPRFQTKSSEVGRVATRLVMMDIIEGGALFDSTGHEVQTFGERVQTGFEAIRFAEARIYPTVDPLRVEFYYPPEVTATPFHLLIRVQVGEITNLASLAAERVLMLASASGSLAGLMVALVVWLRVARPMRRILTVVERVISDPATADSGSPMPTGSDEVGALGTSLERFRTMLATTWRNKVVVAENLLERAPLGVVQLAMDGAPTFSNLVAADMFGRDVVKMQSTTPIVVRDMQTGERAVIREHLEKHGSDCRLVEIVSADGPRYAMCGGLVIGIDTRSPSYLVLFTEISELFNGKIAAEEERDSAEAISRVMNRRNMELRLSLEACLSLLGGEKAPEAKLEVLPFVEEWLTTARQADFIVNASVGNESPMVAGGEQDLRSVMRLAMLLVYARTGSAPVAMVIEGRGINFETAGFTIRAQATAAGDSPEHAVVADWQLALAALRAALRRVGGQLSEFNATEEGAVVKFVLRGAAERMQTGIKAAAR